MFNDNDNDHLLIRKLSYSSLRQLKFGQAITTTCIGPDTALHILFLTSLSFFKLRSVTVYCGDITRGILGGHVHFWAGTVRDWPRPYLLVLFRNSRANTRLVPGVPGRRQNFFGNKNLKNVWLENWIRVFGVKLLNCIDPKDWWVEKSKKLNATFWMCVSS